MQLEACVREAEKIASLVNMKSPRIASELSLSSLTLATIVHTDTTTSDGNREYLGNIVVVLPVLLSLFWCLTA